MDTNWEMIKFQFEILGVPLEDLAKEHGVSMPVLKFNAETWKPIPLAQQKVLQFPDTSSLETITKEMVKQVKEQSRASSILKQKYLGPKYIALEALLLSKASQALSNLDVKDRSAANSIKTLTSVLKDLLEQNSILHVDSEREDLETEKTPTKWEITFVEPKTPNSDEA